MRETLEKFCRAAGREELLSQWDIPANLPLMPENITHGSKRKIWWRCEKGHRWQAAVYTRTGSESGCPVCAGKLPLAGETDLASRYPNLAKEWHPSRNGGLTPEMVLPGSHRIVWWVCSEGHEWRAQIKSRVSGCGCPVCANREIRGGDNSLAHLFPALAEEWHPSRNGSLTPENIPPGTSRRVWWQCKHGHIWRASVASRTSGGSGCPVCAGKTVVQGENDLASRFPALAAQWHPTQNGSLTPEQVTASSNRKVWWICEEGHAYQAVVASRTTGGSGCPYCAGRKVLPGFNDLASREPLLAKQWHPTLNGTLTPEMVTLGSHRKVWWICSVGHVWKAVIYSRTGPRKCGCPVCAGVVNRNIHMPIQGFDQSEGGKGSINDSSPFMSFDTIGQDIQSSKEVTSSGV